MNLAFSQSSSPLYSKFDLLELVTTPLLPPGTDVYANASLSFVSTVAADMYYASGLAPGEYTDQAYSFSAAALILEWTVYQEDGITQSDPQGPPDIWQSSVRINNCATITFGLYVDRAYANALFNLFSL